MHMLYCTDLVLDNYFLRRWIGRMFSWANLMIRTAQSPHTICFAIWGISYTKFLIKHFSTITKCRLHSLLHKMSPFHWMQWMLVQSTYLLALMDVWASGHQWGIISLHQQLIEGCPSCSRIPVIIVIFLLICYQIHNQLKVDRTLKIPM